MKGWDNHTITIRQSYKNNNTITQTNNRTNTNTGSSRKASLKGWEYHNNTITQKNNNNNYAITPSQLLVYPAQVELPFGEGMDAGKGELEWIVARDKPK